MKRHTRRDFITGAGGALAALAAVRRLPAQNAGATRTAVWLDMDRQQLDAAYDNRAFVANGTQIMERSRRRNAAARERLGSPLTFAYGSGPDETLDVYRPRRDGGPVLIYLHGGAWRAGVAQSYAYLAEPFVNSGAAVALVDFSPVEEAPEGLSTLVRQVAGAVAWTYRNAPRFGGDPGRIHVSGHSSGGHLAAMSLTAGWRENYGLPEDTIKGGMCVSGIYDLEPVRLSYRNDYLQLTDESVRALSPQRRIDRLRAPLIVAYGTYETREFQRQARDFAASVEAAGKPVRLLPGPGFNHFEILPTLADPYGLLGYAALEQMGLAPR